MSSGFYETSTGFDHFFIILRKDRRAITDREQAKRTLPELTNNLLACESPY